MVQSGLRDGNSLSLTTTNATDKVVTDTSVPCMRDTKHGHHHITKMLGILAARDTKRDDLGATSKCREVEGIANCHVREMGVDLCGVDGLASETTCHLARSNSLIVDKGFVVNVKAVGVASYRSHKSRAARARGAENGQHLAATNDTFEAAKDVNTLLLLTQNYLFEVGDALQDDVPHCLLIIGRGAKPVHAEVPEGDSGNSGLDALNTAVTELEKRLGPLPRIEFGALRIKELFGRGRE